MTSATLFREGTDLDTLLAELDEQYDGQIRVVEINHMREGGVLGFFARPRVAVHFTIEGTGGTDGDNLPPFPTPCPARTAEAGTLSEKAVELTDPLDALIAAAEMVETGILSPSRSSVSQPAAVGSGPAEIDGVGNVEFARMLLDIAARKAAERGGELPAAGPAPEAPIAPAAPALPAKIVSAVQAAAVSQAAEQAARTTAVPGPRTAPIAPAASEPAAIEPIAFEELAPPLEVTKPKAVRVAKPKTATTRAGKPATKAPTTAPTKASAKSPAKSTKVTAKTAEPAAKTTCPTAAGAATTADTTTTVAATGRARAARTSAATKTETAAALEAKIAAVGESLRAELSIADLHESDERLTLRRRLSELGVPFDRIPTDAPHRYAAVEQLVHALPGVAPLPESDGQLVVVAGPATQAAATAELLIKRMSLLPWQVWAYRCPGIAALPDREIRDAAHATTIAAQARQGSAEKSQTMLVVIGLDEFESEQLHGGTTAATIVRALGPDAFWLHVDATRKASDTAALVRELGTPTALVVTGAARTASPASVWDLNVPVALLDGRPATPSAWAVLLLDKLTDAAA